MSPWFIHTTIGSLIYLSLSLAVLYAFWHRKDTPDFGRDLHGDLLPVRILSGRLEYLLFVLMIGALANSWMGEGAGMPMILTMALVPMLYIWAYLAIQQRQQTTFKKRLIQEKFLLCPGCLYSLAGSPPQGRCSECGRPYDPAILIQKWCHLLSWNEERAKMGNL